MHAWCLSIFKVHISVISSAIHSMKKLLHLNTSMSVPTRCYDTRECKLSCFHWIHSYGQSILWSTQYHRNWLAIPLMIEFHSWSFHKWLHDSRLPILVEGFYCSTVANTGQSCLLMLVSTWKQCTNKKKSCSLRQAICGICFQSVVISGKKIQRNDKVSKQHWVCVCFLLCVFVYVVLWAV